VRAFVRGVREREEVHARMAAFVASTWIRGAHVRPPTPAQAHADPRAHFESDGPENDVEGLLAEERELREKREAKLDEPWAGSDVERAWDEEVEP
jgi:hypothetical protein